MSENILLYGLSFAILFFFWKTSGAKISELIKKKTNGNSDKKTNGNSDNWVLGIFALALSALYLLLLFVILPKLASTRPVFEESWTWYTTSGSLFLWTQVVLVTAVIVYFIGGHASLKKAESALTGLALVLILTAGVMVFSEATSAFEDSATEVVRFDANCGTVEDSIPDNKEGEWVVALNKVHEINPSRPKVFTVALFRCAGWSEPFYVKAQRGTKWSKSYKHKVGKKHPHLGTFSRLKVFTEKPCDDCLLVVKMYPPGSS